MLQFKGFVLLLLSISCLNSVAAVDVPLSPFDRVNCNGMKAGKKKGDSFISLSINNKEQISEDSPITVAIFNYKDHERIGDLRGFVDPIVMCDESQIERGACKEDELHQFLLHDYQPEFEFLTYILKSPEDTNTPYEIEKDGYYCVVINGLTVETSVVAHYNNYYGKLPVGWYNTMKAHGWLVVAHFIVTGLYGSRVWKFKNELLRIQRLILAYLGILTVNIILQWSAYKVMNISPIEVSNATKAYAFLCALFNLGGEIFTLYLLVLLALGQSVVFAELAPEKLKWYKYLLGALFIADGYIVIQLLLTQELSGAMTISTIIAIVLYIKILRALRKTTNYLKEQGETVKLSMYRKLGRIILVAYAISFVGISYEIYRMIKYNDLPLMNVDYVRVELVFQFFPKLVYFVALCSITYLWRPKETSYLLALSKQLPTDPDAVIEETDNGLLPSDDEEDV